ncbi:MAG: hypothetical protein MUC93_01655 [Bacteroidales bacterium]|jgi:hypothetical protein|nr:hypothetical protein [Bacteroidales bacterium]
MQNKLLTFFLTIFILFFEPASGQKLVNSPLSRFNLGSIEPAGSFRSIGMGGIGTAIRDNNSIYFSNPASYSSLDTNSFVFDFGLDYGINHLSEGTDNYVSEDLNFDHLLMGFPINKGWGIAIGVYSLSNGYYKIIRTIPENPIDHTGEYIEYNAGEGSLTNFFLGTGSKITKNFSAGVNMSVLFGSINRANQINFADYYNVFSTNATEKLRLSGINLDYGLQYTGNLKKDYFINAGISFSSGKHCKSDYEKMAFRFTPYGSSSDTIPGTYVSDDSTKAFIPGTLRAGLAFGKKNKFVAGIDYVSTKWSDAIIKGAEGYLGDTRSLLFGVEYIPDKSSNYSFVKRMEYRLGGHIEDNYLVLNGKQVKEFGISLGVGIPMRRTFSKANLFADYTRKSVSTGADPYLENYFTMGISLNLYDFWFIKRKYD